MEYEFNKGDIVFFNLDSKQTQGKVVGYLFYGADKACQSPKYLVEYKTRFLKRKRRTQKFGFELKR